MLVTTFCLTAAIVILLVLSIVISIITPSHRVWPPLAQKKWQYCLVWTLTVAAFLGVIVVGIADWNSLAWPSIVRWSFGSSVILLGNVVVWLGVAQLTLHSTSGAKGELVTEGLYRYTRNPQYLADVAILIGWIVLSASVWVIPLAVGGIVVLVLTPFAEEPCLEEAYGAAYRSYREEVPRFLVFR